MNATPFPNLLNYPSMRAFLSENPGFRCSTASYYRAMKRQKAEAEKLDKEKKEALHSILKEEVKKIELNNVETKDKAIGYLVEMARSQNLPIKSLLPVNDAMELTHAALQSIKRHMVTQWQCAAFFLERVHPEIFAKKDAPVSTTNVIGIRLEIAHRTRSLSKKDDITRLSVSNVKDIKLIDNVSRNVNA